MTKLIEVALPIEEISAASRADKDRKTGTIKNVHKWFAPMPTPALRALLFAAVVDDPGEGPERAELLRIVKQLVPADGTAPHPTIIERARAAMLASTGGELPLVYDPFCGGGSTLVEALRLGLPAAGSDLNPVPVLITTVLTDLVPRMVDRPALVGTTAATGKGAGTRLAGFLADVRHYAELVREQVWEQIGHLYPPAPGGGTIVAWLWARTVVCRNPACRAIAPLVSSLWLSKRKGAETWLEIIPGGPGEPSHFEVRTGKEGPAAATKAGRGGSFRCATCTATIPEDHVKAEGVAGRLGTQLMAVAVDGPDGRSYRSPDAEVAATAPTVERPDDAPDLELSDYARWFSPPAYGMTTQADLYTNRQLVMLGAFADVIAELPARIRADGGDEDQVRAICAVLALMLGKLSTAHSSVVRWFVRNGPSKAVQAFASHALPMVWDFAEANPVGESVGDWLGQLSSITTGLTTLSAGGPSTVAQLDARSGGSHLARRFLLFTDPPYFAAIGYADLSDYFYVWHRRALRALFPDMYRTIATPKDAELIAAPHRAGNLATATKQFLTGYTETFHKLAAHADPSLPMVVVYAHRQEDSAESGEATSKAWDSLLTAILQADLRVVATWPIHATHSSRQIGQGTNALASYMILVCRPKVAGAPSIAIGDYRAQLRAELPKHVRDLRAAGMGGVDLGPSMIGPGIEVFCRSSRVYDAQGRALTVSDALREISSVLGEVIDDFAGDLADDQATLWAMRWFAEHGFDPGPLDHAERLCLQSGTLSVEGLRRAGLIAPPLDKKVRLLQREELPTSWRPDRDRSFSVWELFQQVLHRFLTADSERGAAELLARAKGSMVDVQDLGYWLYTNIERSRPEEARRIDQLLTSWPRIAELVETIDVEGPQQQVLGTVEG